MKIGVQNWLTFESRSNKPTRTYVDKQKIAETQEHDKVDKPL